MVTLVTPFEYPQFCPLARAAEILGERWTLLLARELLLGPRRYSDLLQGLRPISSSVLTGRLAGLEERGLVTQRTLPPPAASTVYELTELGRTLRPILLELGRFGARFLLPARGEHEYSNPEWTLLAPSSFAKRGASPTHSFSLEVQWGETRHDFFIEGGARGTRVREERGPGATTLRFELPLLVPLLAGGADLEALQATGALRVDGDTSALAHFSSLFEMDFGDDEAATALLPTPETN